MKWILNSIRRKLTLSIILLVFILLTVLMILSYTSLTNYSLNNAQEQSEIILNETDSKISRFFLEINYLSQSLSKNSTVYSIQVDSMKELFITTVQARKDYLRAIYLGTVKGDMYEWGFGEGFINNSPLFPDDYDPRLRPWYKSAINAKGFTISQPYIYASINALGITCVVQVYDSKNVLVGVLGLDIILGGLANIIENLQMQKKGSVMLLNQHFEILADQFDAYTGNITKLKKFEHSELINGDFGYYTSETEKGKTLTSYKIIDSTGWILLVSIPFTEIMEFSDRILSIILFSEIFLMFILLVTLTIFLHKIITEPLSKMIGVMKAIEYGDVNARIVIRGGDEFSTLGKIFNQLEDIRQQYTTSMKQEIENSTKEITELQNENMELRILKEKERIFRNLHDSLGARLTNIFISNNVAKSASLNNNKLLNEMLNKIDKNTKQGIRDLKEIIFKPVTGDRTIIDFVKLLGFNIQERLKLKNINFKYNPISIEKINEWDNTLRFEIEKLLQEIVSNILKHADAETVYLELGIKNNIIYIDIGDDGIGFIFEEKIKTGFGIKSIIARVERLNGKVDIISSPGKGVAYKISIPNLEVTVND